MSKKHLRRKKLKKENIKTLDLVKREDNLISTALGAVCAGLFGAGLSAIASQLCGSISVAVVILTGVIAAAFNFLSLVKPIRKLYPIVPMAIAFVLILFGTDSLVNGSREIANSLISIWNTKYSDAVAVYSVTGSGGAMFAAQSVFVFAAIADLLIVSNLSSVSALIFIVTLFPVLLSEDASCIGAGIMFIAVMSQYMYRFERNIDLKKIAWLALMSGIMMIILLHTDTSNIRTIDDLRNDTKAAVEEIRFGKDTLPEGDLSKAYLMNKGSDTMLTVNESIPKTLYLRGFIGAEYSDGKWQELTMAHFRGENDGIEEWLSGQDFTPAQQYALYLDADGTSYDKNDVTVKMIGADREYVYLPYSARNADCSMYTKRDSTERSDGIFGANKYSFTEYSGTYPGELLYPDSWITDPSTEEQQKYMDNEEIYRSFVYKSYLEIDPKLKKLINELFTDSAELDEKDITVYNVTQHIHSVLESTSSYSKEPPASSAEEPITEFLNGGTGNSAMYATAAVMAYRAFGIPARYAEGYYVDESAVRSRVDTELTQQNAHAWAEVYIDCLGWVPIDCTPGFYQDAYSLMEMVEHPKDVEKTASFSDDSDSAEAINNTGKFDDNNEVKERVKDISKIVLGVLAMIIIFGALVIAVLEIRAAIMIKRLRKKYDRSDLMQRQRLICVLMPKLLACFGIEMHLGWNVEETEEKLRERFPDVNEGEYVRVNQLMEKCIYGEEELPEYELRVLCAFVEKLADVKRKSLTWREKLKMRHIRPPKEKSKKI